MALVTGASSGIGEATALRLQEAGFDGVRRRPPRRPDGGLEEAGVHAFAMDVTDDASMVAGVDRIVAETRPDRRTGQQRRVRVVRRGRGRADRRGATAVRGQRLRPGPADPARHAAHARAGSSGRIINISSIGGKFYEPLGAWYHATKFAVEGFSDSLRLELAPFGIDVVIIEPGPIVTEWNTISRDSLVETSRGGAYEERARRVPPDHGARRHRLRRQPPDVVARKIVKAATARRPRTRYPVGRGAGSIVLARRLLPDRAFDAMISTQYR